MWWNSCGYIIFLRLNNDLTTSSAHMATAVSVWFEEGGAMIKGLRVISRILPCSPKCVWTCKKYKTLKSPVAPLENSQLYHTWQLNDKINVIVSGFCARSTAAVLTYHTQCPLSYSHGWCKGSSAFLELKRKMREQESVLPSSWVWVQYTTLTDREQHLSRVNKFPISADFEKILDEQLFLL